MPKGSLLSDTFEQLTELGQSTAKQTVKAVKQTFNPKKIFEKTVGSDANQDEGLEKLKKEQAKKQNHTPLDVDKLHKKYQDQDKQKLELLRAHLFHLVKSGEEKVLAQKKQEKEEKKRRVLYEEMEKKRKEEERKKQEEAQGIPKGKIRRSIFSPKKVAERQQTEMRPASGKQ